MIEDILLDIFGSEKPSEWERTTAYRTARQIDDVLGKPSPRTNTTATIRVAYFDMSGIRAKEATNRIFSSMK